MLFSLIFSRLARDHYSSANLRVPCARSLILCAPPRAPREKIIPLREIFFPPPFHRTALFLYLRRFFIAYMQQKVRQVEKIFKAMDRDLSRFRKVTGVGCPEGCILCCLKPDLEASVLEFLPLAWHLVKTHQHEAVLDKIESGQNVCISLNTVRSDSSAPGCGFYAHRGAICRLFGSAALRNSKNGQISMYSCKVQKENHENEWNGITSKINQLENPPIVSGYYYQLMAIDPHMAADYNPINQSIYKAISKVAYYLSHRPQPNAPWNKAV